MSVVALLTIFALFPVTVAAEFTWGFTEISSDGTIVTSPSLPRGEVCIVEAQGVWYSTAGLFTPQADAQYYRATVGGSWVPAPNGHSFLQLGTGIPQDVDWGPLDVTDHKYLYTLEGEGKSLKLRIVDWIDGNSDNNNCHIDVKITCSEAGGCWITGGGRILNEDGTFDSYGGNAMTMKAGDVRGEWNHVDHEMMNHFKGDVTYITCDNVAGPGPEVPKADPNHATFGGTGRYNNADGYFFEVEWVDHAEGGIHSDRYQLTIWSDEARTNVVAVENGVGGNGAFCKIAEDELGIGCTLSGNLQIHPPNQGHPY